MCGKVEQNSEKWVKEKLVTQEDADMLYALCEQGKVGDCNTARPGMMRFAAKRQWDAWNAIKGTAKEQAQKDLMAHAYHL